MGLLLSCQGLTKQFGAKTLFSGVALAVNEGERHGVIGPNGAGKSTLLKILAGMDDSDSGEVAARKGLRLSYVPQEPEFEPERTAEEVVRAVAHPEAQVEVILGQTGFHDASVRAGALSGGWRKRLAIAQGLAGQPDLLMLDEPTNHLDLEGIEWLEEFLRRAPFACMVITHDRYFLENVATNMLELNPGYPEGTFKVAGAYSAFLEKREEYLEAQAKQREALAAVVRREVEWLRRGAKARTRKAKARVDVALARIDSLQEMEARDRKETARIDFTATDRKTKKLVEAKGLSIELGGKALVRGLNLVLSPGQRLGLAGANGSGKTTFLRVLTGELAPSEGELRRADLLRVVYFEQMRQQVAPATTLKRALAPEGDSVLFQGRTVHVNGWAKRFLFREEQLPQPVGSLSGGERARVHIARLMLSQADLLLLDEPTNDLDIPTLEVLEENLVDFPGALVLVTHDRYLMDRVATGVLGLDGSGGAVIYADLAQWEADLEARAGAERNSGKPEEKRTPAADAAPAPKKKFSYNEQREWDAMEGRILEAEARVAKAQSDLQAPATVTDGALMAAAYEELQQAQAAVDLLYARWAELEARLG
jgi:ATP-binding cassette subfamily F protein uup